MKYYLVLAGGALICPQPTLGQSQDLNERVHIVTNSENSSYNKELSKSFSYLLSQRHHGFQLWRAGIFRNFVAPSARTEAEEADFIDHKIQLAWDKVYEIFASCVEREVLAKAKVYMTAQVVFAKFREGLISKCYKEPAHPSAAGVLMEVLQKIPSGQTLVISKTWEEAREEVLPRIKEYHSALSRSIAHYENRWHKAATAATEIFKAEGILRADLPSADRSPGTQ